nr:PAS domain S-box protein [Dechloromonas sp.]
MLEKASGKSNWSAPRTQRLVLVCGLLCCNLLVFFLAGSSLFLERRQYETQAEVQTQNIAGAIDQSLSGSVERVELALRSVSDELERQLGETGRLNKASLISFLERQEKRLPEVEAFRIADAAGTVIIGRGVDQRALVSWSDRDYFVFHRDHPENQLHVARPRMGRVAKQPIVGFSVRYNYPDGRFAGVVSAPISIEYFNQLLYRYNLGGKGALVLRDLEFRLIARVPAIPDRPSGEVGSISVSDELRQMVSLGVTEATYRIKSRADDVLRIYTFHRVKNAQMIALVGIAEEDYLASWRAEGLKMMAMAAAFSLLSFLLGAALLRQMRAAEKRAQILADSESRLTVLVEERTAALLATEARASQIIQSSADGLFGIDASGRLSFVNPAACAMLGYEPEQLIGRQAHPLIHHSRADGSSYPEEDCPSLGSLVHGQTVRVDNEVFWHADGHPVPVMYATHPIVMDGVITGSVTSFVDVSVQRAASKALEQALLVAEHLARMRREFIANVSHEMRTPLNGILGFADIGLRNIHNSDKAANAFRKIEVSGQRLLATINDLLDFSSLEVDKLRIELAEVDIAGLVSQVVEANRERAAAHRLTLNAEFGDGVPASLISDPRRLGQILNNLLSNAVKFSERGSIVLSVSREERWLIFRVSDTGIGMTQQQIGELFNPFQQADASNTRRFGGTGLGLAISSRLVALLGGSISVESTPGSGSVFTVRLPYEANVGR